MSLEVRGLCLSLSAARPASDADLESQQRALLENISFRLAPGEIAVIRGPSGTGKSTLLKALAALIPFDSGSVTLDGKWVDGNE